MERIQLFTPAHLKQELLGNEYITIPLRHPLEDDKGPLEFVLKDNKEYINLE